MQTIDEKAMRLKEMFDCPVSGSKRYWVGQYDEPHHEWSLYIAGRPTLNDRLKDFQSEEDLSAYMDTILDERGE